MKLWLPDRDRYTKPPAFQAEIDWSHPLSRGLVGCWLLNEGGGAVAYDLLRKHNGTLSGGAYFGSGGVVYATDEYISLATDYSTAWRIAALDQFTCTVRFKSPSGTTLRPLYTESNDGDTEPRLGFRITTGHKLNCRMGLDGSPWSVNITSSADVDDGLWHTAVFVKNRGTGFYQYVDGVLTGSVSTSANNWDANYAIDIGRQVTSSTTSYFVGETAFCFIRNVALSLPEIQEEHFAPYSFLRPVRTRTYFVAGGAAPQDVSFSASGGAIAGGAAGVVASPTFAATGGAIAGGAATATATPTFSATGGAIAGGSATITAIRTQAAAGGALAGGSATVTASPLFAASGGAVAGGAGTATATATFTSTGGAIAGGTATVVAQQTGSYSQTGDGGAIAGGAASITATSACLATGGAIAGGSADVVPDYFGQDVSFAASGGAIAGGSATVVCEVVFDMSGGAIGGGAATVTASGQTPVSAAQRRSILGLPPAPTAAVDSEDRSTWLQLYEFGEGETEVETTPRPVHEIKFTLDRYKTIKFRMPVDA